MPDPDPHQTVIAVDEIDELRLNWIVRAIGALDARMARLDALYTAEIERLDLWHTSRREPLNDRRKALQAVVAEAVTRLRRETGVKSFDLPAGLVRTRLVPAAFDPSGDEFFDWAQAAAPDVLFYRKPTLDRAAARLAFKIVGDAVIDVATGEVVPGMEVRPERVAVTIEAAAPDIDIDIVAVEADDTSITVQHEGDSPWPI